ncbi:MAG TPA: YkgJ family cysteine cluster protein [Verrucomicrobiota bacterium]|nr:YkgJ family cysteine cluster protein [Verrucomicrobiota bacterium]
MKPLPLHIPVIQNWSCHSCTDCCRNQLLIRITPAEKERIENQNWSPTNGVDPDSMIVAEQDYFRLNHRADGTCVFLNEQGRCRIHEKFGEDAKPLACRLYPLTLTPVGGTLVVGLRFSCPSAAANRGTPLTSRETNLKKLAAEVVPPGFKQEPPPPIADAPDGDWAHFRRFIKWLDASMSPASDHTALKLIRTLHWLDAIERDKLDRVDGNTAEEILEGMVRSAARRFPSLPVPLEPPSRTGRILFRMMVGEHARAITVHDMNRPGRYRWRMLRVLWRFARAAGSTPEMRPELKPVPFSAVEQVSSRLSPSLDAALTRYFRMKIQSVGFCGRAFHNAPLIEGFRSLALLYPIILWLARWHAASHERQALVEEDLVRAITIADYHHGFSRWSRRRVRLLAQRNDIARLCAG